MTVLPLPALGCCSQAAFKARRSVTPCQFNCSVPGATPLNPPQRSKYNEAGLSLTVHQSHRLRHMLQTFHAVIDILGKSTVSVLTILVLETRIRFEELVGHGEFHGALGSRAGVAASSGLGCGIIVWVGENAPVEGKFRVDYSKEDYQLVSCGGVCAELTEKPVNIIFFRRLVDGGAVTLTLETIVEKPSHSS